jgi:secreted Zn-dependent insulinase-like peptidase
MHISENHRSRPDLLREPWYDTQYAVESVSPDALVADAAETAAILACFSMPRENLYISSDFQIKNAPLSPENTPTPAEAALSESDSYLASTETEEYHSDLAGSEDEHLSSEQQRLLSSDPESQLLVSAERPSRMSKVFEKHATAVREASSREEPSPVFNHDLALIWFLTDRTFLLPMCRCYFKITLPYASTSPTEVLCLYLLNDCINYQLNEALYDAALAGLRYGLETLDQGLLFVRFNGYNEKLPLLVLRVFEALISMEIKEEVFDLQKLTLFRSLTDSAHNSPYDLAAEYLLECMVEPFWSDTFKAQCLQSITFSQFTRLRSHIWSKFFVEGLVMGNIFAEEVVDLMNVLMPILQQHQPISMLPEEKFYRRCINLPRGTKHSFQPPIHPTNPNSGYLVWWQIQEETPELNIYCSLLAQILEDMCYDELRTKEQLGYLVQTECQDIGSCLGLSITVQSADYPPQHIATRVNNFMQVALDKLKSMSSKIFHDHIESMLITKTTQFKRLKDQGRSLWNEIRFHNYHFQRVKAELDILWAVTQDQLIEFFETYFIPHGTGYRPFEIAILAHAHQSHPALDLELVSTPASTILVADPLLFKRQSPLCAGAVAITHPPIPFRTTVTYPPKPPALVSPTASRSVAPSPSGDPALNYDTEGIISLDEAPPTPVLAQSPAHASPPSSA